MKNPNDRYYQIQTPNGVISKSQHIPNPKNWFIGIYLSLGFGFCLFGSIGIYLDLGFPKSK